MRVFNICYILMSEFLYAMSSPPSSSVHRFQPRSLPFTGIEGASTGQRVEGASRSGQVMQHLDDLGIRPTEKLIPIKDTPHPLLWPSHRLSLVWQLSGRKGNS
ncbi:hypothetical protein KEM48_004463 [Puccinia striiformis f. sp. tritici PST-130]|nr:hypothetical protein KEM48_004463 [Puccinia striiformis f. sp. tritici PST-130]